MSKKGKKIEKKNNSYDKGQVFVKVMAGALVVLMLVSACATLIYCLMA